mmetsp:Transcript_82614/g.242436  ORF Transcript_82614/g.242436 Transcript_82614/m.242436 type:complete len:304 (+) Transcript_82614:80-991(+)
MGNKQYHVVCSWDQQICSVSSCHVDNNQLICQQLQQDELNFQEISQKAASSAAVPVAAARGSPVPRAPCSPSSLLGSHDEPPAEGQGKRSLETSFQRLSEEPSAAGRPMAMPEEAGQGFVAATPEKANLLLELTESLHLTGNFAKWSTNFPQAQLQPVPSGSASTARLKLCVKMTSMSFSFQVVSSKRQWNWRLYPRDAQPLKWAHVSQEGRLQSDKPDAVAVGVGDLNTGHGLNFHVVEEDPTTVTIWVEVPVSSAEDGLVLQTGTATGARVWYTKEDTGVQFVGGDGVDLNKYKWMRPAGW